MTAMKISWVCEPPRLPPSSNVSGADYYRPFIAAIGRYAGLEVPMLQGWLRDVAPAEGFILVAGDHPVVVLDDCPRDRRAELASRLVPMEVDRPGGFLKVLEELSVPAAVDGMGHQEWTLQSRKAPDKLGARGPYGLREIGQLVGASCSVFKSERYCYLTSPTHHGMPHLLADYLAALHRTRSPA